MRMKHGKIVHLLSCLNSGKLHTYEHLTKINIIWSVKIITTAYEILLTDQFCRFTFHIRSKIVLQTGRGDIIILTI